MNFAMLPQGVFEIYAYGENSDISQSTINWLIDNQEPDGKWTGDLPFIETAEVLSLVNADTFEDSRVIDKGIAWLKSQNIQNNDYLFRLLKIPTFQEEMGMDVLLEKQNMDGGWPLSTGYESDVLDTTLAMDVLLSVTNEKSNELERALVYLINNQNADGGWSYINKQESSTLLTAKIIIIYEKSKRINPLFNPLLESSLSKAKKYLISNKDSDGTWGITKDSISITLHACEALSYTEENIVEDTLKVVETNLPSGQSVYNSPSLTARLVYLLNLPANIPVVPEGVIKDVTISPQGNVKSHTDMTFLPLLEGFYESNMELSFYIEEPSGNMIPLNYYMGRYRWNTGDREPGTYSVVTMIYDKEKDVFLDLYRKAFTIESSFRLTESEIKLTPEYYRQGMSKGIQVGLSISAEANTSKTLDIEITIKDKNKQKTLLQQTSTIPFGFNRKIVSMDPILFQPPTDELTKYFISAVIKERNGQSITINKYLEVYPAPPVTDVSLDNSLSKDTLMHEEDEVSLSFRVNSSGSIPESTPGKTYETFEDFNGGNLIRLVVNQEGTLTLDEITKPFNFIWIANSSKGTVMKINTDTCEVVGEYYTSPAGQPKNPSRTTVDYEGNVWVANRDGNSVTKISLYENNGWIDKNNDDICNTSKGLNDIKPWTNLGGKDTYGGVSTAEDECITQYVKVSSSGTRHVSVNKDNNVWVSGTGSRTFNLIDSETGKFLRTEGPVGYGGYGGLIDKNEVIWSASPFLRWDTAKPLSGPNGVNWLGNSRYSYGMTIDSQGNVWNSSSSNFIITKYAADGTIVGEYNQGHYGQGCAAGKDDDIWVVHYNNNSLGRLKSDGTYVGTLGVYTHPIGVAVDAKGFIWITTHYGYVQKIDPNDGPIGADGKTPIGKIIWTSQNFGGVLYNYSDMTGSTLTAPPHQGTWTEVFDSEQNSTEWGHISWSSETDEDGSVEVYASSGEDGITFSEAVKVVNGKLFDIPPGRYIKVYVRLKRSTAGISPIVHDITVGAKAFSGTGMKLSMTLPCDVIPGNNISMNPEPSNKTTNGDGSVSVEWNNPKLFLGKVLNYDLEYKGTGFIPESTITLARDILLTYQDPTGALISIPKDPIKIKVNPDGLSCKLTTDKFSYGSHENVQINLKGQNHTAPLKSFTGVLEIVDKDRQIITTVQDGIEWNEESISEVFTWDTSDYLSGDYGARLKLYDQEKLIHETVTPFEIIPDGGFSNRIYSDKPLYNAGTIAKFHDTVKNDFVNYYSGRITHTITVKDKAGNIHFTQVFDLGNMFEPSRKVETGWHIGQLIPGDYTVSGIVRENGIPVAQSECSIIISDYLQRDVRGGLHIPVNTVTQGDPVAINYTIENHGNENIKDAQAKFKVLVPDTLEEVHQSDIQHMLSLNNQQKGNLQVDTLGLDEGSYIVVYTVEADGILYPMQTDSFNVKKLNDEDGEDNDNSGGDNNSSSGGGGSTSDNDNPLNQIPTEGDGNQCLLECIDTGTGKVFYTDSVQWNGKDVFYVFAPMLPGWKLKENEEGYQVINEKNLPKVIRFYYIEDKEGIHEQYIFGYPNNTLLVDKSITRAEAASMMYRIIKDSSKEKMKPTKERFQDITNHWARKEITYIGELGLISGYPDGTFRPNQPITREELIKILVLYSNLKPEMLQKNNTGGWSSQYVDNAVSNNYVQGYPDGGLHLKDNVTRAQSIAILNRILNRKFDEKYVDTIKIPYVDLSKRHWAYAYMIEALVMHEYQRVNGLEQLVP